MRFDCTQLNHQLSLHQLKPHNACDNRVAGLNSPSENRLNPLLQFIVLLSSVVLPKEKSPPWGERKFAIVSFGPVIFYTIIVDVIKT